MMQKRRIFALLNSIHKMMEQFTGMLNSLMILDVIKKHIYNMRELS